MFSMYFDMPIETEVDSRLENCWVEIDEQKSLVPRCSTTERRLKNIFQLL